MKLQRESYPIINGWASSWGTVGLTAHGRTPEIADINLARGIRLFLTPFQREGTLKEEALALGLGAMSDVNAVEFEFVELTK